MSLKILALETSTTACSAALSIDGEVLERYVIAPREHAILILPMIESLLVEADLSVTQLDAVAFGRGPGSFTGVRIGAGVVQGIAFAADLPVVPVSTLAALALGAMGETGEGRVMTALDARRSEVYWGCYLQDMQGMPALQGEECVCRPATVPLPEAGGWIGAGSGWDAYGTIMMPVAGRQILRMLPDIEPRAADVARLGVDGFGKGLIVSADAAVPVYIRDTVVG
ncbi:MAG: tRNA (adenosine(37)-N6)-threonylcarbamoyltransferase complex dimerization subunit type 1 TsaB [Gammaproteobacteria bacterium]